MVPGAVRPVDVADAAWGERQLLVQARQRRVRQLQLFAVWLGIIVLVAGVLVRFNLDVGFMTTWGWFILSRGVPTTLGVSLASITFATVLALIGSLMRISRSPILSGIASFYVSLFRGTPLLVQIYIIYIGLPQLGIVLPAIFAGVLALSLNYGAYMTEIFRAGIQSIGHGQREAALSLGMTPQQTFRRIIWPQAVRLIIPPIGNEFVAMLKDSSLVSVMGIWELTFTATKSGRPRFKNMEALLIAAAAYWVLTALFSTIQSLIESRLGKAHER